MFCAVNIAQQQANIKIIVIEKNNKLLSKVRISGGGRCNITHNHTSISAMSKCYPRGEQFVKKVFKQFFVNDTIDWFTQHGVPLVAEEDGRMFPKANTSEAIISCLIALAQKHNIAIHMQEEVLTVNPSANGFNITTSQKKYNADYVCITCGGFTKESQFNWLTQLGHTIATPVPSLFTFNLIEKKITTLMGVSVPNVSVKIKNFPIITQGALLITHWGFSGPAILKLSAFAARYLHEKEYRYEAVINWYASENETSILQLIRNWHNQKGHQLIELKNPLQLPNRLWQYLLLECNIDPNATWNQLNAKQQNMLAKAICTYTVKAQGKTTYKDEFVTAGGIQLQEVNTSTCESKVHAGVYFAGEVLDVDGITGGYNFQNAWSTAFVVSKDIASKCS
jgi:predicted Rossmann fold flavoprotein